MTNNFTVHKYFNNFVTHCITKNQSIHRMKKLLFPLALASIAATSWAVTPLWLRDVKISPDGSSIAFTYKGDIYKVAANGGTAQRLTTQPSYESNPVWSPDGK